MPIAATLDDDSPHLRGHRTGAATASRTTMLAHAGSAGAIACCGGLTRHWRRSRSSRPAAKIGAVFAPLNAARVARRGDAGRGATRQGRARLLGCETISRSAGQLAAPPRRRRPPRGGVRHRDPRPGPDVDLDERDPHVIFFTSGSTGRPKGVVLSHRTNWLRTFVGATSTPGGGGTVCMFPLFHMAGWTIALGAWQARRPVHFVPDPRRRRRFSKPPARHRAARLYCIPAVWGRILEHGVARLRPVRVGRGRHRHVGDASGAPRGDQGRACRTP